MDIIKGNKGLGLTVYTTVNNSASPNDLLVTPPIVVGDWQVSVDGGAFVNLTNLPTVTPVGSFAIEIVLTSAEMNGDNIVILGQNASYLDKSILIQTVSDWDAERANHTNANTFGENVNADIVKIDGSTDSLDVKSAILSSGIIGSAGAGTTASTIDNATLSYGSVSDDTANGRLILFTSGAASGEIRRIEDTVSATNQFTVNPAFNNAPTSGDDFVILPNYAEPVWSALLTDYADTGTFGELVQDLDTTLAGAVWDELIADHTTAGTMGSVMSCIYCPGLTAVDFTYTVTDVVTTNPIQGAVVKISTDLAGTNVIWSGVTNEFGVAVNTGNGEVPSLDPGTYYFWTYAGGYDFSNPDTEVVS